MSTEREGMSDAQEPQANVAPANGVDGRILTGAAMALFGLLEILASILGLFR